MGRDDGETDTKTLMTSSIIPSLLSSASSLVTLNFKVLYHRHCVVIKIEK